MIGMSIGSQPSKLKEPHIEFEMITPQGQDRSQITIFTLPVGDLIHVHDEENRWLATIKILRIIGNEKGSQESS
jgi:hypothetical protein